MDSLLPEEAEDYERVKATILSSLAVSMDTYRRRLREAKLETGDSPRLLANKIRGNGLHWLQPQHKSTKEVIKTVLLEQFISAL